MAESADILSANAATIRGTRVEISHLSVEMLAHVVGFLEVRTLERLGCVDRTFAFLAHTMKHRRPFWTSAYHQGCVDAALFHAGSRFRNRLLASCVGVPSVAFLFIRTQRRKRELDPSAFVELVRWLPEDCILVGGYVSGTICIPKMRSDMGDPVHGSEVFDSDNNAGNSAEENDAFSLALASLPDIEMVPFHFTPGFDEEGPKICRFHSDQGEATTGFEKLNSEKFAQPSIIILLVSPLPLGDSVMESEKLKVSVQRLQNQYPKCQIVGGLCSHEVFLGANRKFKSITGEVLGLAMFGDITCETDASRACIPTTSVFEIVQSNGSVIQRLALHPRNDKTTSEPRQERTRGITGRSDARFHGANAVSELEASQKEFLARGGIPEAHRITDHEGCYFFCGLWDFEQGGKKNFRLHQIRGEGMGQLYLDGDIENARFLQLFAMHAKASREDLAQKLRNVDLEARGKSMRSLGTLLFSCRARDLAHYDGKPGVEVSLFEKWLPNCGLVGFRGGGEIGPSALSSSFGEISTEVQAFTAVFAIFMVPEVPNLSLNYSLFGIRRRDS